MRKVIIGVGMLGLALASVTGWQIAKSKLANAELCDDMQDIASQMGARIGLTAPGSDEDFREAVLRSARQHEIDLTPEQVTVRRTGTGEAGSVYLKASYAIPVRFAGFALSVHYTAEGAGKNPSLSNSLAGRP